MLKAIDIAVLRFLRTQGHWPPLERLVISYSRLGEHSAIWFGTALVGAVADRRQRRLYRRLVRALTAVEVINALLKLAIGRKRPRLDGLPPLASTKSQRSCPSAHSASSFAAAHILSQALPSVPVYAAALAMALSRPYLGVHYPSDVLAGMALGTLIAEQIGAAPEVGQGSVHAV